MEQTVLEFWIREVGSNLYDYFVFAGIAFFIFYKLITRPMSFRKVQKKLPKWNHHFRDIFYSLISISIFATMGLITMYWCIDYTNIYNDFDSYGWTYYIMTWVWMFLAHDTYFYWMHRGMHHPKLFKFVHLVHHKSHNPTPWTAYAFHPIEGFLESLIIPILAFSLPLHNTAMSSFFLFQIIYNVYGHLGFELFPKGFHKTWLGRWVNTSVAHNQHHDKFTGNYGLYFLFWDRAMGTLRKDYNEAYEATTERSIHSSAGALQVG